MVLVVCSAHNGPALRRAIAPQQPMWIIHIDTWNAPDPQRIIDMVPEDIRPYVVFNLSLSATQAVCPDGQSVCDSWMKVCARNRVWTMIQCASGSHNQMPENDLSVYEKYFKLYPNFLGWNFAEQFWGFGDEGQPTFLERLQLLANIMKICHTYGGYLVVSFTQAVYSADMNPIAYMKRNAEMCKLLTTDKDHFICCEKYTMKNGFFDIESNCLGAYLGGYAGQYGIRFDACGWVGADYDSTPFDEFPKACGAIPIMEHVMLTGETVIDGPETIPLECSHEISTSQTTDGYTRRNWEWYPHFVNINIDMFRKILDGTVRIPTRREVIDRTKICIKNDLDPTISGNDAYLTPRTLFDGLYRQTSDQGGRKYENHWLDNQWWLKKTGRYPTVPQVYDLLDDDAKQLSVVKKSEFDTRWASQSAKQKEFNTIFQSEYTGIIYAGRHENAWVTYNPYQYDEVVCETNSDGYQPRKYYATTKTATGKIPFKYNTCTNLEVTYAPYTMVVMRENTDKLSLYMQNYRVVTGTNSISEYKQQTDILKINGASSSPTITWKDRGEHKVSTVTTNWENNVYTITIVHNGPLEINVDCKGTATGRLTSVTPTILNKPSIPDLYYGELQYEVENFDYKNIKSCMGNAWWAGYRDYRAQGCVDIGTKSNTSVRGNIPVMKSGNYNFLLRYKALDGNAVFNVIVDGKSQIITLPQTSEWSEVTFNSDINNIDTTIKLDYVSGADAILDCVRLNYAGATSMDNTSYENNDVVKVEYYNLSGVRLLTPYSGVNIRKSSLRNGKLIIDKIIR